MTLDQQIAFNKRRTWLVFSLFLLVFALLGGALYLYTFSIGILGVFGIFTIIYGVVSYFQSGKIIARMTGAKEVSRDNYLDLYHMADEIAISAGLAETPPLYVIEDPSPNAFAAGRNPDEAYIAVTTGLLESMDKRQIRGVLAHEVAHIVARDVRLMSIAVVLVGAVALLSDILLRMSFGGNRKGGGAIGIVVLIIAAILAPLAAIMIQMAISRQREYLADARAADFTGDPEGLAIALDTLRRDTNPIRNQSHATAHLYIESPTDKEGFGQKFSGMFNTHPPLAQRIQKLSDAGGFEFIPAVITEQTTVQKDLPQENLASEEVANDPFSQARLQNLGLGQNEEPPAAF